MGRIYANRYEVQVDPLSAFEHEQLCIDGNLQRFVVINWQSPNLQEAVVHDAMNRLLSVQSPNVTDVYDLVKQDGYIGIVHEYCEGLPLRPSTATTSAELLKLLYQITSAVSCLTTAGVEVGPLNADRFCHTKAGVLKLAHLTHEMLTATAVTTTDVLRRLGEFASNLSHACTGLPNRITDAFKAMASPSMGEPRLLAADMASLIAAHLVKDMHRAVLTHQGRVAELSATRRSVTLSHPSGIAQVEVEYDGLEFQVSAASGEVYINNLPVLAKRLIPDACIIALGAPQRPSAERQFVTMDLSHPEVVL